MNKDLQKTIMTPVWLLVNTKAMAFVLNTWDKKDFYSKLSVTKIKHDLTFQKTSKTSKFFLIKTERLTG